MGWLSKISVLVLILLAAATLTQALQLPETVIEDEVFFLDAANSTLRISDGTTTYRYKGSNLPLSLPQGNYTVQEIRGSEITTSNLQVLTNPIALPRTIKAGTEATIKLALQDHEYRLRIEGPQSYRSLSVESEMRLKLDTPGNYEVILDDLTSVTQYKQRFTVIAKNSLGQELSEKWGVSVAVSERGTKNDLKINRGKNEIQMRGVQNPEAISRVEFISKPSGFASDIVVVDNASIDSATVRLEKTGSVPAIYRCEEYSDNCDWERTNIPFVDHGDYVEFNVTSFSAYGIILISDAVVLDSNRNEVVNVYDLVRKVDGTYAAVKNGEYVRVTFERALQSFNDITIYARTSADAAVEIYEADGTEVLDTFYPIVNDSKQRIVLSSLNGSQAVFDLRVVGGIVEFDYITDPTDNLDVTSCETTACTATNLNTNDTTSGVTLGKGAATQAVMDDLPGTAATINSVVVRMRWNEGVDTNGDHSVNLQNDSGNTDYCTAQTNGQGAIGDEYVEFDFTACRSWTVAEINDLQVDYTNNDAAKGGDVSLTFVDVYVNYTNSNLKTDWTTNLAVNDTDLYNGTTIEFNATGTDPDSDNYQLVVCDTNSITDGYPGTCVGNELCTSAATTSGAVATCTNVTNNNMIGTSNYYGFLCDVGSSTCNTSTTVSITITENQGPNITVVSVSPNPAENGTTVNVSANITDTDGLDTVTLTIFYPNGSTYATPSFTAVGDTYSGSFTAQSDPSGNYTVQIFANDTFGANSNSTELFTSYLAGSLNVSITNPIDATSVNINETFTINATVTCVGSPGSTCGVIEALVRYNASSSSPDTAINTSVDELYIMGGSEGILNFSIIDDEGDGTVEDQSAIWGDTGIFDLALLSQIVFTAGSTGNLTEINFFINSSTGTDYLESGDVNISICDNNFACESLNNCTEFNSTFNPGFSGIQNITGNHRVIEGERYLVNIQSINNSNGASDYALIRRDSSASYNASRLGGLACTGSTGLNYADMNYTIETSGSASNPKDLGTLNEGNSMNVSWEVNFTGNGNYDNESYEIDVNFNSSLAGVTDNDTEDRTVFNDSTGLLGFLNVNITNPTDLTSVNINETFTINATVTCVGGICGTVSATPRYNFSSANADTIINESTGATPLQLLTSSVNYCYQETFNESTECGGLATGNQVTSGTWNNIASTYDGNYGSYGSSSSGSAYSYVNYSIPSQANLSSSLLQYKISFLSATNISLSDCAAISGVEESQLMLRIYSNSSPPNYQSGIACHNSSDWTTLIQEQDTISVALRIYEEAVYWNITAQEGQATVQSTTLNEDQSFNVSWEVNFTGNGIEDNERYEIDVNFSSTLAGVADNDTEDRTVQNITQLGFLNVTIINPINTTAVNINETFTINATVTCVGGSCGTVSATPRYNLSSTNADTIINESTGATPLQLITGTTQSNTLNEDQSFNVSWEVNFTGNGIEDNEYYKIDVNFSSTLAGVADNNTEDRTVQNITQLGFLNVTIINPINTTAVNINETFTINATVTCVGGSCGTVSATPRYNLSSTNADTIINDSGGATPLQLITGTTQSNTLNEDQSFNVSWEVNFTGNGIEDNEYYKIDVNFSSTLAGVADNNTEDRTVQNITQLGFLNVTIINPINTTAVNINETFTINATVTCVGGSCGTVSATPRYNLSSTNADTIINDSGGATPLQLITGTTQSNTLNEDQSFNVSWEVNFTGNGIEDNEYYKIDVNFSSTLAGVADNNTEDRTVQNLSEIGGGDAGPPVISNLTYSSTVTPLINSNVTFFLNFTATDPNGSSTLTNNTAAFSVTNDTTTRTGVCSPNTQNSTHNYYNCSVQLRHYDFPGVWSISTSIDDENNNTGANDSETFTYNELFAMALNVSSFDFGVLEPGELTSYKDIYIDNQGNVDIPNLNFTGYSLVNESQTLNSVIQGQYTGIAGGTGMTIPNNTQIKLQVNPIAPDNDTTESGFTLGFRMFVQTPNPALVYTSQYPWEVLAYE